MNSESGTHETNPMPRAQKKRPGSQAIIRKNVLMRYSIMGRRTGAVASHSCTCVVHGTQTSPLVEMQVARMYRDISILLGKLQAPVRQHFAHQAQHMLRGTKRQKGRAGSTS